VLELVDALARLELAARRLGWSITVTGAPDELVELLDFVGLELRVEVSRQTEGGEQLGVEEAVVADDPTV